MGMSTQDMIKNVQDGKIATEDFFDAIAKVGTNKSFTKLATEYKTVGQAMDGLSETAANKLQPALMCCLKRESARSVSWLIRSENWTERRLRRS